MAVERNYFSSEKLLFFPRSFIYFDFGKNRARGGSRFYRVALLSNENKNKISYLSVEWIDYYYYYYYYSWRESRVLFFFSNRIIT